VSVRVPPQNLEAEEYVLGAMMVSPYAVDAVADILSESDFYRESHALVFAACVALRAKGSSIDAVTVFARLERQGHAERVTRDRIIEIATLVPAATNAAHHARVIREHAVRRSLIDAGTRISDLGWEPGEDLGEAVEEAERIALAVDRDAAGPEIPHIGEIATETYQLMREQASSGRDIVGLTTGYRAVDRLTSGLRDGNLIIVAGRPSMGKSAYVLGLAAHCALRNDPPSPVAIFSYEMSRVEIMQRLYSAQARIETDHVLNPARLDDEEWGRIDASARRFTDSPLFIDDDGSKTMSQLRTSARRLKQRQPDLAVVIVDYVQLMMSGKRAENRNVELSQISRQLKLLAGELELPVIAVSQLSRDVERRHEKIPMLSDLRESGALEQDADLVMFLYRPEYYYPEDEELQGIAEVHVAKHRNGPIGMRKLAFVKRHASFSDLEEG
jgi:replicative DNA helicase